MMSDLYLHRKLPTLSHTWIRAGQGGVMREGGTLSTGNNVVTSL